MDIGGGGRCVRESPQPLLLQRPGPRLDRPKLTAFLTETKGKIMNRRTILLQRVLLACALVIAAADGASAAMVDAIWSGVPGGWNTAASWSGLIVPNNGAGGNTYHALIDNGNATASVVSLNISPTIDRLTISSGDELSFPDNADLSVVVGPIANSGLISMNSAGNGTDLRIGAPMSLTGSGVLSMGNHVQNIIRDNFGGNQSISNSASHTIRGAGQVGINTLTLTNDGLIDATQVNTLSLDLTGNETTNFNTGTMQASGGGTLEILNSSINNSTGLIQALTGSNVRLNGSAIFGGDLSSAGTGFLSPFSGVPFLSNVNSTALIVHDDNDDMVYDGTITNEGVIQLNSGGSSTEIRINSLPTTFAGTGEIVMSNNFQNVFRDSFNGARSMVNGPDHTIRGSGQLGVNTLTLTNEGLINANQPNVLQIDLVDSPPSVNNGILQASASGTLNIFNTNLTNTDALIQALDNSIVNFINSSIIGGELHTEDSGALVTSTSPPFFQNITLTGLLRHNDNGDAAYDGTITNNGVIQLNSAGNVTEIRIHSLLTTFAGTGEIVMSNNFQNVLRDNHNGARSMVNGADHTIRGAGQVGANTLAMTNDGLIDANQPSVLQIDMVDSSLSINNGILQASAGGTLNIVSTNLTNTAGLIQALDNSIVNFANSSIIGGELHTEDSGALVASTSPPFFQNITLTGLLRHNDNQDAAYDGTITNNGVIQLNSAGNVTEIRINADATTFAGTGEIAMSNNLQNVLRDNHTGTHSMVNGPDHAIHGAGQIGINTLSLTNNGLIDANQLERIQIDLLDNLAANVNNGTIQASAGGRLDIVNTPLTNTGGLIQALDASSANIIATTIVGGELHTEGTGAFSPSVSPPHFKDVTLTGLMRFDDNEDASFEGTFTNNGTISLNSAGNGTEIRIHTPGMTFAGTGEIVMSSNIQNIFRDNFGGVRSMVNGPDHTIRGAGSLGVNTLQITNQGAIIAEHTAPINIDPTDAAPGFLNEGVVAATGAGGMNLQTGAFSTSGDVSISAGSQITRTGSYIQTAGSTTVNGTLSANGGVDIQAGILGGSGTIVHAVTNAGTVTPGNSAGTLTLNNSYTQTAAGELAIEIGGLTVGTQYDRLAVTGAANLDGALSVSFINGFNPQVGDIFTVMTYASRNGTFAIYDAPCNLPGRAVQVDVAETSVRVLISDAPTLADINCDCTVTLEDALALSIALTDPLAFADAYPGCDINNADLNGDLLLNGRDVQPFVDGFIP